MLDRREFVGRLLKDRGDLMVLTGLGTATFDVAAYGDNPLNFYIWSAMGCTSMVGLGLAMARPDRRIAVITGDGDVLMALGSLATIGAKQPANLSIICLDNAHYAASGMQPSATAGTTDLAAVAKGCGFKSVLTVAGLEDAEKVREQTNIRYLRDAAEAIEQVHRGEADVAFLTNPVTMEQLREVAFAGSVMPQKSTDFFPKLLSGLTIYALE